MSRALLPRKRRRRPVPFTEANALKVLDAVASGLTLKAACRLPRMPDVSTIYKWSKESAEFGRALAEARRVGAGAMADQLVTLTGEMVERAQRGELQKGEVAAVKEHSATLRWFLERWAPGDFGPKATAAPGVTVTINTTLGQADTEANMRGNATTYTIEAPVRPSSHTEIDGDTA